MLTEKPGILVGGHLIKESPLRSVSRGIRVTVIDIPLYANEVLTCFGA